VPGGESPTRRAPRSGGLAGRSPKPGDTRQDARGPSLAFVGREQRSLPAKSESEEDNRTAQGREKGDLI
ncbi:MAG: hypothetical protein ABJF07_22870, partial [Nisaea sp.]|uniref:hypothetical protein n=1 Tax=Nisaea sp. TaxID=2024842 RepID=UPI0032660E3F